MAQVPPIYQQPIPKTRTRPYILGVVLAHFSGRPPNVQLFRIGAFVVWNGQVVPIMNLWVHREGATYCLHSRPPGKGLVVDTSVTFGQLLCELNHHARFCVGDKVEIGPFDRYVKTRWWNSRTGTVHYRVASFLDPRDRSMVYTQQELVKQVEAYAARSA